MKTVKVKICGITREEDVKIVSNLGADAVGFIVGVPSSPRNLSLNKAEKLIGIVPSFVKSVLVMVPKSLKELFRTCEKLNPSALQIHGENILDTSSLRENLSSTPIIRAINVYQKNILEVASNASKSFDAILLDSASHGMYGGTGKVHDWKLSKRIKRVIHSKPLILAGGLHPENVQESIRTVQPYAVDVSSGVESRPGIKDPIKISTFIENVKELSINEE
jgi:phosphoribosylanthranilate isomerase